MGDGEVQVRALRRLGGQFAIHRQCRLVVAQTDLNGRQQRAVIALLRVAFEQRAHFAERLRVSMQFGQHAGVLVSRQMIIGR